MVPVERIGRRWDIHLGHAFGDEGGSGDGEIVGGGLGDQSAAVGGGSCDETGGNCYTACDGDGDGDSDHHYDHPQAHIGDRTCGILMQLISCLQCRRCPHYFLPAVDLFRGIVIVIIVVIVILVIVIVVVITNIESFLTYCTFRQITIFTGQRCKTRMEASQRAAHQRQSPRKSLKIWPKICKNLQEIWRNQICPEMTKKPSDPPKSAVSMRFLPYSSSLFERL